MNNKPVTEEDFRKDEYKGAKVEDYERRVDGSIARKDRWENCVRNLACYLGIFRRDWEVSDVEDIARIQLNLVKDVIEASQHEPPVFTEEYKSPPSALTSWQHNESKNIYTVIGISNLTAVPVKADKYPIEVIYMRDHDKTLWTRKLELWYDDFTFIGNLG